MKKTYLAGNWKKHILFLLTLSSGSLVLANPVLNNVGAGQVTIQQQTNSTVINQSSPKAILNWKSFNINANESTHFQQPTGGATLNRIDGSQGASKIFGQLSATGQIILINSAGIYFGPSASVNVGGIIASTADIRDQDFLNGNYTFSQPSPSSGAIVNEGRIVARDNGLVALLGNGVVNNGYIEANVGKVVLASGETFTLSFSGDNLINFSVDTPSSRQAVDKDGKPLRNGVQNTGSIIANGGKVMVAAKSAKGVLDNVINMEGVVQAKSVAQQNGEIILGGDPTQGVVRVAGKLITSGKSSKQTGGKITITGKQILIDADAEIDASGDVGGGDIHIGGNYQGKGPLPNATALVVMPSAKITTDALTNGNGGELILWSNEVTKVYGSLSAKGGSISGNGGLIETSGHYLDVAGIRVDTFAKGNMGLWLLDPFDVYITTSPTSNGSFTNGVFTPSGNDANILNSDIVTNLATTSVAITTSGGGTQNGDIYVNAPISWATNNSLTLTTSGSTLGSIYVNQPITWTGTGTVNLTAVGSIFLNSDITGINGSLALTAANAPNSITSGIPGSLSPTGVTANINVKSFNLVQGQWFQSNSILPTFTASTNFQLNSGATTPVGVKFIRVIGGQGTTIDPYQVQDIYGLQGILSDTTTVLQSWLLTADINAAATTTWNSSTGFMPLGNSGREFGGRFNGGSHTISNLYMAHNGFSRQGLFGQTSATSNISYINLANINVAAGISNFIGGVVGFNQGAIDHVSVTGSVTGQIQIGGIAGGLAGASASITNSWTNVYVSSGGPIFGNGVVGGIVGNIFSGLVSNVSSSGTAFLGGQVPSFVGGIAGSNAGTIEYAYSDMIMPRAQQYQGGIAGINSGIIRNSVSAASLPQSPQTLAGGIAGANSGTILNTIVYGFISPALGGNAIGGITGSNTGTITNSFWNINTTSYGINSSAGSSGSIGYMGLTNAQMLDPNTFIAGSGFVTGAGFDFNNIWSSTTNSYPYLKTQFTGAAPQVIGGTNSTATIVPSSTLNIVKGGTLWDTTYVNADGSFYFLEGNRAGVGRDTTIANNTPIMIYYIYNGGASRVLNTTSDMSNVVITPNRLTVDNNFSNSILSSIVGNLNSVFQLYTASGNNIAVNINSFNFRPGSGFTIDGNITTAGTGDIQFGSDVVLAANSILTTTNQLIQFSGKIDTSGPAFNLTLSNGAGLINLTSAIGSTNPLGTLTINSTGTGVNATNLGASVTVGSLLTNAGGTTAINGGSIITTGTQTFNDAVTLGADTTLTSTGNISVLSTLNGNSHQLILNDSGSASVFNGIISNLTAFTKNGSGTITLSAANSFTGPTSINNGVLRLGIANGISNTNNIFISTNGIFNLNNFSDQVGSISGNTGAQIILGSGTLNTGNSNLSTVYSGTISGTGGLTKSGTGTLTLAATNSGFTGLVSVTGGTLSLTANNALGSGNVSVTSGAMLNLNGSLSPLTNNLTLNGTGISNGGALSVSGTNILSGTVTLGSASSIGVIGSNDLLTANGIISGAFGLTKLGLGTLILGNASNSFTGSLAVSSGTVQTGTFGNSGVASFIGTNQTVTLGTATTTGKFIYAGNTSTSNRIFNAAGVGGGILEVSTAGQTLTLTSNQNSGVNPITYSTTGNLVLSGIISGSGGITKNGAGALTLSGNNNFSNTLQVQAGLVNINSNTAFGTSAVTVSDGAAIALNNVSIGTNTFNLAGSGIANSGALIATGSSALQGSIVLANNTTISSTNASDSLTLSGAISGNGLLTKSGAGTLTLSNNNSYTNGTDITSGTLRVLSSSQALGTGAVTVASGAVLNFSGTLSGVVANNFLLNGTGIANAGALVATGINTIGGTVTFQSGSTINVTNLADSLTLNGLLSGPSGLTKIGNGSLILGAVNSYSGSTTISAGSLALGIANAIPNTSAVIIASGANLNLNNLNQSIGTLSGLGTVILGSGVLSVGSGNFSSTFDGSIQGSGGLTKLGTGSFTLTNNNSLFTGLTNINNGSLIANNNNALGTGNVWINTGGRLTLNNITLSNSNLILNGGDLNANGPSAITGSIQLNTASSISSNDTFNLNAISGNYGISFLGTGTNILNGAVNVGSITTANTGTLLININSINTTGSQTYLNNVVLGNDVALTGSDISFSNTISGNRNLSLTGTNMTINAIVNLNNVNFVGSSANNTVTLDTKNSQTWNITGDNEGNINATGIANTTFTQVQNLVGGLSDDTFIISNGVRVTSIDGGTIGNSLNTINYTAYTSPISVRLGATIFEGITSSGYQTVNNFANINSLIATAPNGNSIILPTTKASANVVITAPYKGYINDPLYFDGFGSITNPNGNGSLNYPNGTFVKTPQTIIINGIEMNFYGFNLTVDPSINTHVSQIITRPNYTINYGNNVIHDLVITNLLYIEYSTYLRSIRINLNCAANF